MRDAGGPAATGPPSPVSTAQKGASPALEAGRPPPGWGRLAPPEAVGDGAPGRCPQPRAASLGLNVPFSSGHHPRHLILTGLLPSVSKVTVGSPGGEDAHVSSWGTPQLHLSQSLGGISPFGPCFVFRFFQNPEDIADPSCLFACAMVPAFHRHTSVSGRPWLWYQETMLTQHLTPRSDPLYKVKRKRTDGDIVTLNLQARRANILVSGGYLFMAPSPRSHGSCPRHGDTGTLTIACVPTGHPRALSLSLIPGAKHQCMKLATL